ncbi:hypothetical protein [Dyadobacter sediminis]|uniref:Uncharacterized protein n=1 Tax=Dyadobacter sediminis TaxID=1493691 RepID=A0A5R9KB44_9BACT|nr:hypothetical protein [Dyadobacter sediminis]TLU91985.1 hypothetical protein FEM55_14585 [Dyadobacter sediminis]GGB98494.1 hypothetical protein GCM10011325_27200 [Dyadobacter sediminis]
MNEEQKKGLGLFGMFGAVIYFLTRPRQVARYSQGVGTMTAVQLAESYRELISSPLRVFINPVSEAEPDTGTPWAVDLAKYTKNYEAVKKEYLKYYGGDLSQDLIAWFRPAELSEYVAALWDSNKQAMS